jgi:hypothetical protein
MKNGNEEDQSFKSLNCCQVQWSAVSVCQHGTQTKTVDRTQRPRCEPSSETPYFIESAGTLIYTPNHNVIMPGGFRTRQTAAASNFDRRDSKVTTTLILL